METITRVRPEEFNAATFTAHQRQLVVFQLGDESFCVVINKVRQINLRGQITPVIDMCRRKRMRGKRRSKKGV